MSQQEFHSYESTVWHQGRMVRARLHYARMRERSYDVTRLIRVEELAADAEPPAAEPAECLLPLAA